MTQPYNPASFASTTGYPPSSSSDSSRPIKPEPIPLQHHHQNGSSSSLSNGYRSSNSASTASTANTSEHSPYGPCSPSSTSAQLPPPGSNGAAALLQQHQANQHAFRSTSAQHSFVFANQSGPSTSSFNGRQGMDVTSRESSASSGRSDGAGGGGTQAESDYDPFRIKHRRRTSPPQLKILEYHFDLNPKPDVTVRKALSEQLEMTPREVQVWFQNRRAKVKKLKEKAERDGGSSSRSPKNERSPPPHSTHSLTSPNLVSSVVGAELPVPPNGYPGSQAYPPRTIYGQEAISHSRASPPAPVYPMQQHYTGQPLPLPHPHSNDHLSHPAYAPPPHPSAYQSTVYTTTVASSTYATSNEYLPPPSLPSNPSFALLPQDPYGGRRYSLPVLNGDQSNSYSQQEPSADGYPPYQPPSSTAFASSTLSASNPTEYPSPYSSSQYHDRRPSYASDSLLFDSSSQAPTFSLSASIPSTSSYLPPTGTDSFSSFNPYSSVPPTSGVAPSRLLERRASMAAANAPSRERVRSKPYDMNERRSPTHSQATVDQ